MANLSGDSFRVGGGRYEEQVGLHHACHVCPPLSLLVLAHLRTPGQDLQCRDALCGLVAVHRHVEEDVDEVVEIHTVRLGDGLEPAKANQWIRKKKNNPSTH